MSAPPLNLGLVAALAIDQDNLPRVLAGMGFERQAGPLPRGGTHGFEPAYARLPARTAFRQPEAQVSAFLARRRAELGALNRSMAAWPCRLMVRDAEPRQAVLVCEATGEWRHVSGGARGEDLIELGALMWGCRREMAAFRVAALCGHGDSGDGW